MIIVPRSQWTAGLANPSAGKHPAWMYGGLTPRPVLHPPLRHLVVHYAGGADGQAPGNQFLSISSLSYMRNMFMWAHTTAPGKQGDEYNYCIAGTEGTVYEWAGTSRAAHCSYWNDNSIGVQLGLDIDDAPTTEMAAALLALRKQLVAEGVLTPDHRIGAHYEYLGTTPTTGPKTPPVPVSQRATSCWGDEMDRRRPLYVLPLPTAPVPQPPVNPKPLEAHVFVAVPDHPRHPTILVIYERLPGGKYAQVQEADATFVARTRSGTDLGTWASSQPRVAYADISPFLLEA